MKYCVYKSSELNHEAVQVEALKALQEIAEELKNNPTILLPSEDIDYISDVAQNFSKKFDDIVVIGMGGAILNPAMLLAITHYNHKPNIYCLSDIESNTISRIFDKLQPSRTGFVVISKSGNTLETLSITGAVIEWLNQNGINDLAYHMVFITGNHMSPMVDMIKKFSIQHIVHSNISGRFASFSSVVIFPALLAGLDINLWLQTANLVMDDFIKQPLKHPVYYNLLSRYAAYKLGIKNNIIISFCERLHNFTEWIAQMFAESLGKNGHGITPIRARGPLDNHSQLQLYLDGPKDKLINVLYVKQSKGLKISNQVPIPAIHNKYIEDVLHAEYSAFISS